MKKGIVIGILLALISGVLVSCGEKKEEVKATAETTEKKHLNAALYWFGESMDPADGWSGWTLTRVAVGETLVTVDENLKIVGQLADSWENINETTWKFHIRKGVKFHSGNLLTPELVKASIERSISMNERGTTNLKLESIEVDGEYVIFKTKQPYGAFLANLSEPLFIIVDTTVDTNKFKEIPIATGPYKVVSYEDKVSFNLNAFDEYWGEKAGLDTVTVYNIGDDNTRALALQSGDVDIAQGIRAGNVELFNGNEKFEVKTATGTRIDFMFMNTEKRKLSDKNLRLAVNSAVNYEAIAKTVGAGAIPVGAPFPPSTPYGYNDLNKASYDLAKAKEYLTKAGYKDSDGDGYVDKNGENLELEVYSGTSNARVNTVLPELVQAQLKDAGIKANVKIVENVFEIRKAGDFDLLFTNWQTASTGDSQWFLDQAFKTGASDNYGKYSNKELDEIIEKLTVTFDVNERAKLTKEASQIIIDEGFGCYLISQANINIANKTVKNFKTFPIDYYFLTTDITVSK